MNPDVLFLIDTLRNVLDSPTCSVEDQEAISILLNRVVSGSSGEENDPVWTAFKAIFIGPDGKINSAFIPDGGGTGSESDPVWTAFKATFIGSDGKIFEQFLPSTVAKTSDLQNYVQKETGKGLSSNDYTSAEKQKLSAMPTSDELQTELDGKLATVAVDGTTITGNGTAGNPLKAISGGGGGGTAADVSVDQSDFVKIYGDNVQDALQAIDGILSDEVPMPAPDDKIYGIKNQQYVEIPPVPTNLVKGVLVNGEPVVDPLDGVAKINWDVKVDGNSMVYDGVANIDLTEKLDKVRASNLKQAIYGFDMYGSEQTVFPTDDPDRMPQPGAVVKRTSDGGIKLADGSMAMNRDEIMELIFNNLPTPSVTTEEVTAMFTFSPQVAKPRVWMRKSAFSDPEIVIEIENASDGTSDLTITAAGGFGAYFNHTGNKAIPIPGINPDTGMGALYPVTITGETDQAQTVITVPAQVQSATIKYTLGKTIVVPLASYYTYEGVDYPFERGNTPLSNFIGNSSGQSGYIINGRVIERTTGVQNIRFGDSYLSETIIPAATDVDTLAFVAYTGNGQGELDIRGLKNITTYPDNSFKYTSFKTLQIGSIDGSLITTVGDRVFYSLNPMVKILADTQAGGEAFRSKFPNLSTATIVVNS